MAGNAGQTRGGRCFGGFSMARNRMYRLLMWNMRGLNNPNKCSVVKNFLLYCKCVAVCFQETKLEFLSQEKFRSFCGFHLREFRALDAVGTRGGLITAWNPFLFDCIEDWSGSYSLNVVLKNKSDESAFLISNIYGPTCGNHKEDFSLELRSISLHSRDRWAVLGDFNVLLSLRDKNGLPSNINEILSFRKLVNDLTLRDIPLLNKDFTWSNSRRNPTLERLDRVCISEGWLLSFPRATLRALPRPRSDHTPLLLSAYTFVPAPSLFRFESYWLRYPAALEVCSKAWSSSMHAGDPIDSFSSKLDRVRKELLFWSAGLNNVIKAQTSICLQWLAWLNSAEECRVLSLSKCKLRPLLKRRYEELCLQ